MDGWRLMELYLGCIYTQNNNPKGNGNGNALPGAVGDPASPFKRRKRKRKTSMKSERNSLKFTFDFHVFVTFWELGFLSELAVIDPN